MKFALYLFVLSFFLGGAPAGPWSTGWTAASLWSTIWRLTLANTWELRLSCSAYFGEYIQVRKALGGIFVAKWIWFGRSQNVLHSSLVVECFMAFVWKLAVGYWLRGGRTQGCICIRKTAMWSDRFQERQSNIVEAWWTRFETFRLDILPSHQHTAITTQ